MPVVLEELFGIVFLASQEQGAVYVLFGRTSYYFGMASGIRKNGSFGLRARALAPRAATVQLHVGAAALARLRLFILARRHPLPLRGSMAEEGANIWGTSRMQTIEP